MKSWMKAGIAMVAASLLAGCGSFVRSNVTAFHEWPAQLPENTYVFERTPAQDASLEYRNYENLVRAELNRLGLVEAPANVTPYLKTSIDYGVQVRDVREVYPVAVHPYWYSPAWRLHYGAHGPFHSPFYGPFYDPFYDPLWYGPGVVQERERNYQLYTRELRIKIARFADGRPLYEARVVSEGENPSLANVMPYLVRSAFKDFPGPSGVTRRIELKVK